MTRFNPSLETALGCIDLTAHERAVLSECAQLRRMGPGAILRPEIGTGDADDLLILTMGCLWIARISNGDRPAPSTARQGVRIVADDLPVLVPPPNPCLMHLSETEVELMEFSAADCAVLLSTCRAFRALVFSAANTGVAQLSEAQAPEAERMRTRGHRPIPKHLLH